MKGIEVIIPHSSISQSVDALQSLGLHFTHYETKGRGKAPTLAVEFDRGTGTMMEEYSTNVSIMTVVADSKVDIVIDRILNNIGDNGGQRLKSSTDSKSEQE